DTFAIHSIGHASLMFEYGNTIIHIDPYAAQADYDQYPDADVLLVTHAHTDHYDISAISKVKTDSTILICTQEVKNKNTYTGTINVLANGDSTIVKNIPVKAVPAYNISVSFHAKGVGNGYIVTLGEKRIYIAGDTENIPEMDSLGKIDIAFLPMNLPYTMTPEMAADAAKRIKPDILYIYHFGNSDTARLRSLLSDQDMEIRMGKSVYYESAVRKQEVPASVQNIEFNRIMTYPNPAGDHLTCHISVPLVLISVYDLKGQLLLKNELNGEGDHIIDLGPIASGVYILLMDDGRMETEEWLIVQK
ncbi:MAG TPA: MBL fold metallo-hydrolase, partial [Bacteroidales bacterium]|nr:MBL fold metallo-hydrolase [Bacteroidales bacterium]